MNYTFSNNLEHYGENKYEQIPVHPLGKYTNDYKMQNEPGLVSFRVWGLKQQKQRLASLGKSELL